MMPGRRTAAGSPTRWRCTARSALLVSLLLATACTTTVTGGAVPMGDAAPSSATMAPPVPTSDGAVAWADDVCGALLPLADALSTPPKVGSSDPEALGEGFGRYFDDGVAALDASLAGLAAVGPSPVDGGDEIVTGLTGTLTTTRTSLAAAKTRLDAIDPADPSELVTSLPALLEPLEAFSDLSDPATALSENPALDRAAEQAPNCRALPG